MAAKYVEVPLYPDTFYTYSMSLEGTTYVLEFLYVEKLGLYLMSIFTSNREPLVRGVGVVPEYPIMGQYSVPGLSGFFLLINKAEEENEPYKRYPDKISEYYDMVYVYDDGQ